MGTKEVKTKPRVTISAVSFILLAVLLVSNVQSYSGKICGSSSPCECGSNCSGGAELFENSQSACDSTPGLCFNTIDNCRDGTIVSLNYVSNINVSSWNASEFRVGDTIEIDATLFSSSANTEGVYIVYSNYTASTISTNSNWSVVHSTSFGSADSAYRVRINYTIPNIIGNHTVRVIDEFNSFKNITCGRDANADFPAYSDTDDVTFTVLAQPSPRISFVLPTPSNGSSQTSVTVTVNVTHNETHPDTLKLFWNGTNESYSYPGESTLITKANLRQGNYSFYVWVNDTYGNTNQTETRTVSITTPIEITITHPYNDQVIRNRSIEINLSAKPTNNRTISWIGYALNDEENVTVTSLLNLTADTSDLNGVINETLISYHNLSQSFTPNVLMEITNISLRIKRTGFPNTTLQIRADSANSPSSTVLANISINNATVSASQFSWINLTFNSTVTLQNKTRYWIFMWPNSTSDDYYSWEASDDNISNGMLIQNSSRDLLFRIFDLYSYTAVMFTNEGLNTVMVYSNNTDNLTIVSSTVSFTSDTNPPQYSDTDELVEVQASYSNETVYITTLDDLTSVDGVIIQFNGSNYSMTAIGDDVYSYSFTPNMVGVINYGFHINDTAGNFISSGFYDFTINDTKGPGFSNVTHSPNSTNELDPNVLVNVSLRIRDPGGVLNATLQYKNSSSDWLNTSMKNSSELFWGNFTPNSEGIWTYRILANDTSGNLNYSSNFTINSSLDQTWTINPSTFNPISGIFGRVVTIGNLTVNNTGDGVLSFDLSSSQGFTGFNASSTFTLGPNNYASLQLNATTPLTQAEYSIVLTIDAQNSTASPDSLQSNVTFVAISSGPYLIVEIIEYDSSLTIGDFTDLRAKITNVGNETAQNVFSNWTVPSGWTIIPESNRTISSISTNRFEYHNISADVSSSSSTGSQTISIYVQAQQGANNTASKSILVSEGEDDDDDSQNQGGGGGGGSSAASGGGGGILPSKPKYDLTIDYPKKLELFAGQKVEIEINATNNVKDTILSNLGIKIDGFLISRLGIVPNSIEVLNYLDKKSILLTVDVPKYMKYQNITLDVVFLGTSSGSKDIIESINSQVPFEKHAQINLVILEITKELAISSLEESISYISEMKNAGYNIDEMETLLEDANKAFSESNYLKVKEIKDQILAIKEKAYLVEGLIHDATSAIDSSRKKGIDVKEAQGLLQVAISLFEKGNYNEAEESVRKAILSERLSASLEQKSLSGLFFGFVRENLRYLIVSFAVLGVGAYIAKREFSIKSISNRLKMLDQEEKIIFDLIKQSQSEYFKDHLMSSRLYEKTIAKYSQRMAEIQKKRANLSSRKIGLLKNVSNQKGINDEIGNIRQLLKEVQNKYFKQKTLNRNTYETLVSEYVQREAELEKESAMKSVKAKSKESKEKPKASKIPVKTSMEQSHAEKELAIKNLVHMLEESSTKFALGSIKNAELENALARLKAISRKYKKNKFGFSFFKKDDYEGIKKSMLDRIKEVHKDEQLR